MKERPILFSGPMVRAILEGRKTQTRRIVKLPRSLAGGYLSRAWTDKMFGVTPGLHIPMPDGTAQRLRNPWGWPEPSRLWVRETGWEPKIPTAYEMHEGADTWPPYAYDADGISENEAEDFKSWGWKRRPSIFMPRWASRITLEIIDVRAERLRDITEVDAEAEGAERGYLKTMGGQYLIKEGAYRCGYTNLWNEINGHDSWALNPWVWVIEFKRVIDA